MVRTPGGGEFVARVAVQDPAWKGEHALGAGGARQRRGLRKGGKRLLAAGGGESAVAGGESTRLLPPVALPGGLFSRNNWAPPDLAPAASSAPGGAGDVPLRQRSGSDQRPPTRASQMLVSAHASGAAAADSAMVTWTPAGGPGKGGGASGRGFDPELSTASSSDGPGLFGTQIDGPFQAPAAAGAARVVKVLLGDDNELSRKVISMLLQARCGGMRKDNPPSVARCAVPESSSSDFSALPRLQIASAECEAVPDGLAMSARLTEDPSAPDMCALSERPASRSLPPLLPPSRTPTPAS